ncbi:MAG: alpha/beta hydrolase family protein [Bellilinea sp.]
MRLFENLALFTMLLVLAWSFVPAKRRARVVLYAPLLTWVLLIVHFIVEGARWQMVPAYLLAVGLTLNNFHLLTRKKPAPTLRPLLRMLIVMAFLVLFILIYQLPQSFPVFTLPQPGGQYPVGSTSLTLIDSSREETFTENPDDYREVPVRIWYPSKEIENTQPEGYWSDHPEYSRYLTLELGLPVFSLDHLRLVKTHTYKCTPLPDGQEQYPVILFQHGYRLGYLEQNTSLMETLASNGYVVISLAHPYEAIAVPLADGSTAHYSNSDTDGFMDSTAVQEESLLIWAADTTFVMDSLEDIQSDGPFGFLAGRLDLDQIGLAGMSFGGSTASQVCLTDSRCKAGLTLDSPQYSAVKSGQLTQPFLFMISDNGSYLERAVFESAAAAAYLITIKGTEHYNFSDLTLVSPLAQTFDFSGPISGQQMVRIINTYSLAFFDKHLKDLPAPLLNGVSAEYPEVMIESRNNR